LSSAAASRRRYSNRADPREVVAWLVTDRDVCPAPRRAGTPAGLLAGALSGDQPWTAHRPLNRPRPYIGEPDWLAGWLAGSVLGCAASLTGHMQRRSRDRALLTRQYLVAVASCNDQSCWHASHTSGETSASACSDRAA
jgi:hypothetical protein